MRMSEKSNQAYHLLRLLVQYHDPELCSILDSKKITPNFYVKDWFSSQFAKGRSPELEAKWDSHFKKEDPFLIFFAAVVMVLNAKDELKKKDIDQSEILSILSSMPSQLEEDDIEDLYYLVSNYYTDSTPRSIRSYSDLFIDTFNSTYLGIENQSEDKEQPTPDLETSQPENPLDLSHYLCLPILPAELFTLDTAQPDSSSTQSTTSLRYFLVDCRPADQYNAGHLTRAFHLDCSLMLREPSSFKTAVQALLVIQRQVVASKSNTGDQHLCFIGSGPNAGEEDQYVNMVVASFLQKHQKYVSIVVGGFDAIHQYVSSKSELKESFNKYIVDHHPESCKACYSRVPESYERFKLSRNTGMPTSSNSLGFAHSLFASTTNFLLGEKGALASGIKSNSFMHSQTSVDNATQSGSSMFDKLTTAFVSKSSVIKDRLVETLNTTAIPSPNLISSSSSGARHVSSQDKLGRRYTGGNLRYAIDDYEDDLSNKGQRREGKDAISEPIQEIQIDVWQKQTKILAFCKCTQIKGAAKYPGYVALTDTHLWILREIPHNKGFASIAAKRPLDMIIQVTSKRRQPDLIIFRYGYANQQSNSSDNNSPEEAKKGKSLPSIVASDHLHIPQAFELIRLIKREIVRIMDESYKDNEVNKASDNGKETEEKSEKVSE